MLLSATMEMLLFSYMEIMIMKYLPSMADVKDAGLLLAGQIQQYNSQCSRSDYVRASVVMAAAAYAVVMGSVAWAAASIALFSLVHGPTRE